MIARTPLRIIPVIDVLRGVVVRGIGGRRSEYRPIVSQLTTSIEPVEVARALIEVCQPRELYLADLDAIQGAAPAIDVYKRVLGLGTDLWVDAGIRDAESSRRLADARCHVVVGLETILNAHTLCEIVSVVGANRVVFSLDLRSGVALREWSDLGPRPSRPRGRDGRGPRDETEDIAGFAIDCGITRLIVLDLARVGGGSGTGTEDLCRQIASDFPHVEVMAGGGVNGADDLKRLAECGVRGVLIASALHDKRLPVVSSEY